MTAPLKNGLNYFPLKVEIFDEDKNTPVSEEFTITVELAAVKLLCRIYKDYGYYNFMGRRYRPLATQRYS